MKFIIDEVIVDRLDKQISIYFQGYSIYLRIVYPDDGENEIEDTESLQGQEFLGIEYRGIEHTGYPRDEEHIQKELILQTNETTKSLLTYTSRIRASFDLIQEYPTDQNGTILYGARARHHSFRCIGFDMDEFKKLYQKILNTNP